MVRTARDFFVGISIDPSISDRERRNRARGYASLIRTFGGKASEDPTKLFSTPSVVKAEGGGTAGSAARPVADESDRLRGKVADLQLELEAMRKKLGEGGDADSVAPSALGSGGGRLELTEVLKEQTEVLKKAFSNKGPTSSITTVKTDLHWPTLSDDMTDVKDVAEFYESFEDNCGLANNCQGMSKREMLIALRSRCKGSRLKTFQNIYRQEIRAGNVEADPASVYERIKSKHLLFSESVEEREIRVDSEHAALLKGKLTGHQFEPLFERSIAELEEIGLGKTPRELFLSYLRKVGPVLQKEIRKDKRIWPKETELRAPRSWEEAHKVVLEYEQRESTNRAQVSSVYVAEETPRPRRQPKGGEDSVLNTDTGKGAGRKSKICFHFRDHGNCPKGDKCEYSHDKELRKKALAELRARGDSVGATSDRGGKGGKGRGRGKGNGKGRDRTPSGGRTRRDSPRRRADSPDRGRDRSRGRGNKQGVLCPYFLKNGSCKKGSGCDMVHALVVTENQQNTQSQGAATSSAPAATMSQAAQAAAQPPLLGLASASLSSPFGILAEEVLPERMAHVTMLAAGVVSTPAPGAEKRALDAHSPTEGNTKKVLKVMDKPEVRLYRVGTALKSGNSKLTLQVPGKGILLSKPVPPPNTGDGKVTSLDELPTDWWTVVDNASGGYQYKTLTEICGVRVETMLDGCAGSNHVTEELVCGMLNKAKELGLKPDDPKFPVVQMERWVHAEAVHGIAASSPVPLKGAVVMRVTLLEGFTPEDCKPSHEILVRAKISAKGRSDWHGLILGGRSLDCQSRGGLGFRPGPTAHMLDTLGIGMPRVEHMVQRPDRAYVARSVVSSLDSCVGVVNEEAKEVLVLDSPEVLELGPDDGALVPVKRVGLTADLGKDSGMLEALLPVEGKVEAVPGMWPSGSTTGHALVVNPSEWDSVLLEPGEPVAEIQRGHASMCLCEGCSVLETVFETKGSRGQPTVRRSVAEDSVGCVCCSRPTFAVPVQEVNSPEDKRTRSRSLKGTSSGLAPWLLVSCIAALAATCTRSLHIVEKYGVVERLAQGSPTAAYYEALRADLGSRHPNADRHLVDHMVSLEAFLDRSIIVGFSFGVNKALVAAVEGKLLGHTISRDGCKPDPERTQAVRDFPPLKEKVHVQQFLGCANWLRIYLPSEFAHAAKVLGEFQKTGAKFPDQGLGPGDTPGDKAVRAIKEMMTRHIMLNVFDEAAAVSGRCPLEQIADASGIAVGGTVVQMSRDLSRFKVLLTHSKGLTPAQQAWPPLTLEAFAQLEVRRAAKKALGTVRSILWTDHANLTRAQVGDVDVKLLCWVSELVADGSEIRSLAGRSAKLGDGFSRNPPNRDAQTRGPRT